MLRAHLATLSPGGRVRVILSTGSQLADPQIERLTELLGRPPTENEHLHLAEVFHEAAAACERAVDRPALGTSAVDLLKHAGLRDEAYLLESVAFSPGLTASARLVAQKAVAHALHGVKAIVALGISSYLSEFAAPTAELERRLGAAKKALEALR